jgi:cytochrome c oxidase subunit 4
MSATVTDHSHDAAAAAVEHDDAHENHDKQYVVIAAVLAVLTAMEISLEYVDVGSLKIPLLIFLMVVKFILVVLYFMHLKWDAKILGRLFYSGLFLAIAVYIGALASFEFFA